MVEKAATDVGYANLQNIQETVATIDLSTETEADARLKLIDPILKDVLGWLPDQIKCEKSLDGSRLDYVLSTSSGGVVVEAKRPALIFDLETKSLGKSAYPLNGAVLRSGYTGKSIEQVREYAQKHGINLAVASNGFQWIIFLASREDQVPPDKGFAFVFRSLKEILEPTTFRQFYGLISKQSVLSQSFKAAFYKVEGRLKEPRALKASRLINGLKGAELRKKPSDLAKALDPVVQELFITMTPEREREIIRECFVTTRESVEADTRLQRLLNEVTEDIEPIDTRDVQDSKLRQEIEKTIDVAGSRTVLLIGQIGSGKSTYLDRFFEQVVQVELRKKILLVRLDLEKSRPDKDTFAAFIRRETVREITRAIFGSDEPTYEQLKGVFFTLYQQMTRGTHKHLFESNRVQFEVLFGNRLEEMKLQQEEQYLRYLLSHCNKSVKKLPVIIYDNIDHHSNEIQTLAFQQAQWLSGLGKVFSILPVRDATYWQASAEGPFHTNTHVTLYLPRPPLNEVLTRRFKYAELQLDDLFAGKQISLSSLSGIRVKIDKPKELFQLLYKLFSSERYPNYLLRSLSGGNIRESLMLFHQAITSPHMPIDRLLAAYLSQGSYRLDTLEKSRFDKATILGPWAHFKYERTKSVVNLLCFPRELQCSPLLGLRIIDRLYDLRAEIHPRAGKGFDSVDNVLAYFESIGVGRGITEQTIVDLVSHKLVEPYDVSVFADPSIPLRADRIEFVALAPSGRLHKYWARDSKAYGLEMIWDMSIYSPNVGDELQSLYTTRLEAINKKNWTDADNLLSQIASKTIDYLRLRDEETVSIPADPLFTSQRTIFQRLLTWASKPLSELFWTEDEGD